MTLASINADGWVAGVQHLPSDNYHARLEGVAVSLVVIHGISLPPGEFGGDAVAALFTNRLDCNAHPYYQRLRDLRVSAHFFIRRDGALVQFVSTECCAWHAGESTWRGQKQCNDFSIGIELEGSDDTPYCNAQYTQLAELIDILAQRYPHLLVAGHADIAPQRKTDPGATFAWDTLFNLIGEHRNGRTT